MKVKIKRIVETNQLTCFEGLSLVHMEENLSLGVEINIAGSCVLLLENFEDISWKSATMEKYVQESTYQFFTLLLIHSL